MTVPPHPASPVTEGKTKQILPGPDPGTVILRGKDVLTGGDAARVADIASIGIQKTTQAVNVFALLQDAGVPTAFIRQLDDRSMLCWDCEMLPVEFVVRRYAWGSYLLRHPATGPAMAQPQRFDEPVVQRFHKHTVVLPPATSAPHLLDEGSAREQFLRNGVWADGVYTDPFIEVSGDRWLLHPAKVPFEAGQPDAYGIDPVVTPETDDIIVKTLLLPAFEALEKAWQQIDTVKGPVVLADCKFEVGIRRSDGAFVLGDVVDNDSWRIWPGGDPKEQLDKQCFRDGEPMSKVEQVYSLVTDLTSLFK